MSKTHSLYLCVTTTEHSDWRKQIVDLDKFGEDTASVFLTCLKLSEREEMYGLLLSSKIQNISHVHLRDDMSEEEAMFFIKNFKTEVFTIHADQMDYYLSWKIAKRLFVEPKYSNQEIDAKKLECFGGLCVDMAHFFRAKKLKTKEYYFIMENAKKIAVGINHVNGILKDGEDTHFIFDLENLDYLDAVPKELFSPYICLEVENSIEEQIKFREYIAQKIGKVVE